MSIKSGCRIRVWTDGSAVIKGERLGGCGVYMKGDDGSERMLRKGLKGTLTGRAEIHALLLALRALDNEPSEVTFYFDSQYVQLSMREWLDKWVSSNWIGSAGRVKNRDLWEQVLVERTRLHRVTMKFNHVKGHQDNLEDEIAEGNAIADYLADYKTQTHFEEDVVREGVTPKIDTKWFYYYAPPINTVYVSRVRVGIQDVCLGSCEKGHEDDTQIIEKLMDHKGPIGAKKCDFSSTGIKKPLAYYLHVPSKVYFVDEYGKEFENTRLMGGCQHSCSSELYGCLCRCHPILVPDFYEFKLRSEIENDLDTLPF